MKVINEIIFILLSILLGGTLAFNSEITHTSGLHALTMIAKFLATSNEFGLLNADPSFQKPAYLYCRGMALPDQLKSTPLRDYFYHIQVCPTKPYTSFFSVLKSSQKGKWEINVTNDIVCQYQFYIKMHKSLLILLNESRKTILVINYLDFCI
jgi:hypothetical protein